METEKTFSPKPRWDGSKSVASQSGRLSDADWPCTRERTYLKIVDEILYGKRAKNY
jgi:hypothetical protein